MLTVTPARMIQNSKTYFFLFDSILFPLRLSIKFETCAQSFTVWRELKKKSESVLVFIARRAIEPEFMLERAIKKSLKVVQKPYLNRIDFIKKIYFGNSEMGLRPPKCNNKTFAERKSNLLITQFLVLNFKFSFEYFGAW